MPRPRRKKIKFDEISINELLQEIYNDSHNLKAKINRLFLKWENKAKDGGEIAVLGDQIIKLINAEAKNQDQKIMLLKYLKDVVFSKENDSANSNENTAEVTSDARNELLRMVQQSVESKK